MTSFAVRYDVIFNSFPINPQYLMMWGVDSPEIVIRSKEECQPFERLRLSRRLRKIVIRSTGSGYPFEENCHAFERLELSVQNNCQPRYCSKPCTSFTRAVCDEPVKNFKLK